MQRNDINPDTSLPHELSFTDVLDELMLAPHEIATLLRNLAEPHRGGPAQSLADKLTMAAYRVTDPHTYDASKASTQIMQTAPSAQGNAALPQPSNLETQVERLTMLMDRLLSDSQTERNDETRGFEYTPAQPFSTSPQQAPRPTTDPMGDTTVPKASGVPNDVPKPPASPDAAPAAPTAPPTTDANDANASVSE